MGGGLLRHPFSLSGAPPTEYTVSTDAEILAVSAIPNVTINIESGTYAPVSFTGAGQTIRSAPGQWAWFESNDTSINVLEVTGAGSTVEYLGVRSQVADRIIYTGAVGGGGVNLAGTDITARGLLVLDTVGGGFGWFTGGGTGGIVEDCLVLDIGWYDPGTRGHGHSIYTHNADAGTTRTIRRNVFAYPCASTIKTAGKDDPASHYLVAQNVALGSRYEVESIQHYSENVVSRDVVWDENQLWGGGGFTFHFSALEHIDAVMTDNWTRSYCGVRIHTEWQSFTMTGNTIAATGEPLMSDTNGEPVPDTRNYDANAYYSDDTSPFTYFGNKTLAQWRTETGQDSTSTLGTLADMPASTWTAATDEGGALIRVYNPSSAATVDVTTGITGAWWLYDALNPFAGPVASGTGATVTCPMTGLTARTPVGLDPVTHPAPVFGVFVARPTSTWVAPPL